MLTNPHLIAIGIPLILLLCGAIAKKLVRGNGWRCADFFLGVELTLAALGSAMVFLYELTKFASATPPKSTDAKVTSTATFLAIAFFLLLWILSTHQDWEGRTQNLRGQIIWLGIFCNSIGILLFAAFVFLIKGI